MVALRGLLSSANPLFVFEAVARLGGFTAAASELNVTQPAVSRALGRLERDLGCRLIERSREGIRLTAEGQILGLAVSRGFRSVEDAIRQIRAPRNGQEAVTLSVSSGFAAHWLMPRLASLQTQFPNVDLRFQLVSGRLEGVVNSVDLGMRFTTADDPHHQCWPFVPEELVPVCSPAYLTTHGALDRERGAERQTLIDHSQAGMRWPSFRQHLRLPDTLPNASLEFSDYAVVVQAAMLGQGVSIGWTSVVSYAIRLGQLVPACRRAFMTGRQLHVVAPKDAKLSPAAQAIRDWMLAEMADDMAEIRGKYPFLALDLDHRPRDDVKPESIGTEPH